MPKNAADYLHRSLTLLQSKPSLPLSLDEEEPVPKFPSDDAALLPILAELLDQLNEVEVQVRLKFDESTATLKLKFFSDLRRGLANKLVNKRHQNEGPIFSRESLYSLELIAHELDEEPEPTPDDIQEIRATVAQLFEMVAGSDINKKLRAWILNWLSAIRRAIDGVEIIGTRGLQKTLVRIQGEAILFQEALEQVEKAEPTLFSRLQGLFNTIYKASEIGDRCRKLCESPTAVYLASGAVRLLLGKPKE